MRVLIIGKIWPEPESSAAGARTVEIIRSLVAAEWETHFACAARKSPYSVELEQEFEITTHPIALNDGSFDRWVRQLAPELVLFDRYMTEEQFGWRVERALPSTARVLDTSDLHCLREARRRQLIEGSERLELGNDTALREIACILRCDRVLMISEFEIEVLTERFRLDPELLAYWPFSLPAPPIDTPDYSDRKDFMMIGSFLHEPNWDAARWCRHEIWPLIRRQLPQAELHLYGSYTPDKARQLEDARSGFRVKGRAAGAIETLQSYRINLAPLRFGAGLKGKLADAFIAGTPSIVSPIAAEGMLGGLPLGSSINAEAVPFAQEAVRLYSDESPWLAAQACGYRIARERFARSDWLPRLPQLLVETIDDLEARRKRNFLGQMLRHHQHRSTEYMSRWIEAKNASRS